MSKKFVVTDGVYKEENTLFDKVTPEWEEYCKNELSFELPDYTFHSKNVETKNQISPNRI